MTNDEMKRVRDLADAWQEQKRLSDEQEVQSSHFASATPHQLIKMWDTGLNPGGKKLSPFEFGALVDQWCKVFGCLPPSEEDDEAQEDGEYTIHSAPPQPSDDHILSMTDVVRVTGLSKSTIKRMVLDDRFPKPVRLSVRRLGWFAHEVKAWLSELNSQRTTTRH